MKAKTLLRASAWTLALAIAAPAWAQAQDAAATDVPEAEQEIVVTGIRASLSSAQSLKRNADTVVDSIVAEDIGKLPDVNVSEALQRITGIQVQRDVGEGAGRVQIRGLGSVETTINGRDAFTGVDRTFNLQNLPAELLSRLDVYKAPTANLLEGGLGGTIDIRTRRPFDFPNSVVTGSARARYADLAKKWDPMVSILMSDRYDSPIGEIGLLVAAAYQQRSYRQDFNITGAPVPRTDLIAGQTVNSPNGSYKVQVLGQRRRVGLNAALQWQAAPNLMFYLEGQYSRFRTEQDQNGLLIQSNRNANQPTLRVPVAGSFTTIEGTNNLATGSFANQPFSLIGVSRDLLDENQTYAFGGEWHNDSGLKVSFDLSYDKSYSELDYRELDLLGVAPRYNQDTTTDVPSFSLDGVDLNNLANFTAGPLTQNVNQSYGKQYAGRLDVTYDLPGGFLSQIAVGARYADRSAIFYPTRFFQNPVSNNVSNVSQFLIQNPVDDFFQSSASGVSFPQSFQIADPDALRGNFETIRTALGITALPAITPLGIFDISEKTLAGYAMAKYQFEIGGIPIDGNVGVRVIKFRGTLTGNTATFISVTNPVTGVVTRTQNGFAPINEEPRRTDVLPSFNLRARFTDELQLRLGASRVLTRPGFSSLTPSLTLVPAQGAGSGGNPFLKPFTANQVDASLEYYFSKTGSVSLAGFYKWVNAFTSTTIETNVDIGGILYNITRPINSGKGFVRGLEVGGQTFFDFLPGALDGFGVQANYTFVDSETPTLLNGAPTPLGSLSKHSYNVSALYEKFGLSARVAYNWRSKFLEGTFAGTPPAIPAGPIYRKGYGWLDASINYDISDNVTVTFEGSNLLRTRRESYYTTPTLFNDQTVDDRQFMMGFRFKF
ncbi:TonB-dependent receptor [Sphingomonas psychrotolerans]|uniref:TonB-dependent receptor n=1 Tax=Sphingomonas psychrotolerans TaxID=1327635 RepID=A0A2K8MFP2_9SPHN|nr:TonB-dependent receptor [Sphingomonas psychrotolerans]ATY32693.1 TonB-dependent receptor [Sphingomonas psychrotolerans]